MKQAEFRNELSLLISNKWEFTDRLIQELWGKFNFMTLEKWHVLCKSIFENCERQPVFATFYKEAIRLDMLNPGKSEHEIAIEHEGEKLNRKDRLNIISKHFPDLVKKIKGV